MQTRHLWQKPVAKRRLEEPFPSRRGGSTPRANPEPELIPIFSWRQAAKPRALLPPPRSRIFSAPCSPAQRRTPTLPPPSYQPRQVLKASGSSPWIASRAADSTSSTSGSNTSRTPHRSPTAAIWNFLNPFRSMPKERFVSPAAGSFALHSLSPSRPLMLPSARNSSHHSTPQTPTNLSANSMQAQGELHPTTSRLLWVTALSPSQRS